MTSIAESHSPKHQPPRSPNPPSGMSGRRRSTDREASSIQQSVSTGTSSSSRYSAFLLRVRFFLYICVFNILLYMICLFYSRSSQGNKILTHQMSSGALTAALGRSNRDRDITDLVPSAPECSYAACFCEVMSDIVILSSELIISKRLLTTFLRCKF